MGLAGLKFSIAEEMFSLCSKIRVKSDIVMIVMQNKLWITEWTVQYWGPKNSDLIRF